MAPLLGIRILEASVITRSQHADRATLSLSVRGEMGGENNMAINREYLKR